MFEILQNITRDFQPTGYQVDSKIDQTKRVTNNHPIVLQAEKELRATDADLSHFNRDALRNVWSEDSISFTTKYLATLWWGNVGRNYSRVFSKANMDKLQCMAPRMEQSLSALTDSHDEDLFRVGLRNVFSQMNRGHLKLSYVGPAFFTKVLQFFFAAHPVQCRPNFFPVIADQWMMMAVYCEMTDAGDIALRDTIFRTSANGIRLAGAQAESYIQYIEYFFSRCMHLEIDPWMAEGALFKHQLVKERFQQII